MMNDNSNKKIRVLLLEGFARQSMAIMELIHKDGFFLATYNSRKSDLGYLSHYPDFKNAAIKSMVGSSGRQRAQVDVLKNLEFYLPGLEEQKQIADTLSALDDKIALNNRINHNLAA